MGQRMGQLEGGEKRNKISGGRAINILYCSPNVGFF